MRIGLFTEHATGGPNSAESIVEALVAHRPHGSSIHHYSAPSNLRAFLATRDLSVRAAADRLDVVHAATHGPLAIVALMIAARFGLPVLASFPPPRIDDTPARSICLRGLLRRVRRVLVTSMAARTRFIDEGIPSGKLIVWHPGVDTRFFSPSKRSDALRDWWGVSASCPAVVVAGTLSEERGARLLRSLELALRRTRPMYTLIVAGDGPARSELQARCPNAIFMGTVPRTQMPEVLASADLYVCPNEAISTNLAVLEAQASGLPVVVMERGSARERVDDMSGIVCHAHADFIVETAALIRTESRRKLMGVAARNYALGREGKPELTSVYAEYLAAAELSRLRRRNLEPALIAQGRRF